MKTLSELIVSALREVKLRKSCYPKWIEQGRTTEEKAAHEISCMEEIVRRLYMLKLLEEVSNEMKKSTPLPFQ